MKKKLIEVALPLEAINAESAREKSIRHGHPSTLHLWWARRPLAAARAVIFASLVDDPSSLPDEYPTEEAQAKRRQELFDLIEKLVKWENSNNEEILTQARAEIRKSMGDSPLVLLDPFAGGGAIPLEAQRLGLEAHAHDLNPVAVMINKAMIEIPPKFADLAPVRPSQKTLAEKEWKGAQGLAEDVRYYGEWIKQEAYRRIGHLYPKVKVSGGGEATVIAWIWARTVKCPNPACGCEMPLASSFVLSKKKGKEAWIEPIIDIANNKINYTVKSGQGKPPEPPKTARGANFKCLKCGGNTTPDYIKDEAKAGRMDAQLMAVVAEGNNGRLYITPDEIQCSAANVVKPDDYPDGELAGDRRAIWCPLYGLTHFSHLFTPRQLTALTTFSGLVKEAQQKAEQNALAAGMKNDSIPLAESGTGAMAYGQAVGVYLAFGVSRMSDINNALCAWSSSRDQSIHLFGRQAIPMVWDYSENNVFNNAAGDFNTSLGSIIRVINNFHSRNSAFVVQLNAHSDTSLNDIMISTDPPYYDNISYADLSDFFYIWLRQSLKDTYPDIFKTILVSKSEELVATPYRFEGSREKARDFFEDGMLKAFQRLYSSARDDIPVTIYYAFKQSETDKDDAGDQQTASTGWETMLSAIIQAGFSISGTWPMRTEKPGRMIENGTNALASSIVLVCRKRPVEASSCSRRDFLNALRRELKPALGKLQTSNIAPVDLAQAAIGPGMAVYSRYAKVLEADSSIMKVRSALQLINQELGSYFEGQEGELEPESRFCLELYSQCAFNAIKFGEADVLARAKNTSVDKLAAADVLYSGKGVVRLVERADLPDKPKGENGKILWLLTQRLTRTMETGGGGVAACADIVAATSGGAPDRPKALAYRLFTLAEKKSWTQEALAYNSLVIAWPEIQAKVAEMKTVQVVQEKLF